MLTVSLADKVAVPLFFMVSGALLLGREESLVQVLRHRVLRMLAVLALFLLAQNAYYVSIGKISLTEGLLNLPFASSPAWASWFLLAYTAFLLMLPLLRLLAQRMQPRHFIYLIILHLVFCEFIPLKCAPLSPWLPLTTHTGTTSNIYIYALLGYAAEHGKWGAWSENLRRLGTCAAVALVAGVLLNTSLALFRHHPVDQQHACFVGTVLFPTLFCYMVAKRYAPGLPPGLQRVLLLLGSATFTVMLTENIFRGIIGARMADYETSYAASCAVTLLTCGCGWLLGMLFKRLPFIRRLV